MFNEKCLLLSANRYRWWTTVATRMGKMASWVNWHWVPIRTQLRRNANIGRTWPTMSGNPSPCGTSYTKHSSGQNNKSLTYRIFIYILSCHVQQLFYAFINLETIGSIRNMRYSYKNQCLPLFVLVSAHY